MLNMKHGKTRAEPILRTRISTAQFERPVRGVGRRVDWPRADPRSLPHDEFDYDEGF
jgi:hypothetical protein